MEIGLPQLMGNTRISRRLSVFYETQPIDCITSRAKTYSLINSVSFHPSENLFCAAFTTISQLIIFKIDRFGQARTSQILKSPTALLDEPQHVVFSTDGQKIIAVNWNSEIFTIYQRGANGRYAHSPLASIKFPEPLAGFKPHGMDMSRCGNKMVLAFGSTSLRKRGVALFSFDDKEPAIRLLSLIKEEELPGIPKGVVFSPDGSCVLVTYADANCICVYGFDAETGRLNPVPLQTFKGEATRLFRPEDIRISREGDSILVSNSEADRITSYHFDSRSNRITEEAPSNALENPGANMQFPHGIALSPDGGLLVVSQFGPLPITSDGNIVFGSKTPRKQARINIYRHQRFQPVLKKYAWRRFWSSLVRTVAFR